MRGFMADCVENRCLHRGSAVCLHQINNSRPAADNQVFISRAFVCFVFQIRHDIPALPRQQTRVYPLKTPQQKRVSCSMHLKILAEGKFPHRRRRRLAGLQPKTNLHRTVE